MDGLATTGYLHVHQLKNSWIVQSKDALDDQNMWRIYSGGAVKTSVLLERVYRDLSTFPTVDNEHLGSCCGFGV